MESMALAVLLGVSVFGHVVQYLRSKTVIRNLQTASAKAIEEATKKRPLDVSAEELLRDLVHSGAIVRIERIDPESLLMWRPR